MSRTVQRIVVSGYKSIKDVDLAPGPITVLVGPNGAGKSNFVDAVELLGRMADGDLAMEVGFRGGAHSLLYDGEEPAEHIRLRIEAGENGLVNAYEAVLVPTPDDELIFEREVVEFHDTAQHPEPWNRVIGRGTRESRLATTAAEDSSTAQGVARYTLDMLRGCRVYHFDDTTGRAPVKSFAYASDSEALHPDARNLAPFLLGLREEFPADFRTVERTIQSVAPFFRGFVLTENKRGRVRLRWRQHGSDTTFPADALSDGTLRFISLATLLLQPNPPALLVVDEPELGLHPAAITILAEMMRSASARSQILLSTQSVTLLDQFELSELVVAERVDGATELRRPEPEPLAAWLADYSLGDLWLKNLLGGRPTREHKRRD